MSEERLTAPDAERAIVEFALEATADWPGFRKLAPTDFTVPLMATVWEAMTELASEGTDPAVKAVVTRLKERGREKEAGEVYGMHALWPEDADHHIDTVLDRSARRRLVRASRKVQEKVTDFELSTVELFDYAEREVFGVQQGGGDGPVPVKSRLMSVIELIESGGFKGVPTGYRDLDSRLTGGGFLSGQLVVVAGGTSMGKTAWSIGLAANVAIDGNEPVGYFSIEMGTDENTLRLVCYEARADIKAVGDGEATDHDLTRIAEAAGVLNGAPIYLEDSAYTVAEIRSAARRLKAEHGLRLVIVDHIQDMEHRADTRREQLGGIARGLKQLAKELDITVVALSQLSRGLDKRPDPRPRLTDLKESGDIENNADSVLLLHRPEYYFGPTDPQGNDVAGKAECIIAKQRNGPTGLVPLTWVGHCARFDNAAWKEAAA